MEPGRSGRYQNNKSTFIAKHYPLHNPVRKAGRQYCNATSFADVKSKCKVVYQGLTWVTGRRRKKLEKVSDPKPRLFSTSRCCWSEAMPNAKITQTLRTRTFNSNSKVTSPEPRLLNTQKPVRKTKCEKRERNSDDDH